jgi:hypothetical protein
MLSNTIFTVRVYYTVSSVLHYHRERIEYNDRLSLIQLHAIFLKFKVTVSRACKIKLCCHNCSSSLTFFTIFLTVFSLRVLLHFMTLKNSFLLMCNQVFSMSTAFSVKIQTSNDCFKKGLKELKSHPGEKGGNFQVLNRQK